MEGIAELGASLRDRRIIAQAICPVMPDNIANNNASMMVFDLTRSGSILDFCGRGTTRSTSQ